MRRIALPLIALMLPIILAGCGGSASGTASVNIKAVSNRLVKTLAAFDAYLRRYDYKEVDSAMSEQFNKTIQHDLNAKPRFHNTLIATTWKKNGSIVGHGDLNENQMVDPGEPKLFNVEFDADNNRVIVTSAARGNATGHRMPRGNGFFAGVMVGSILNRQTTAGIKPGHFNQRKVVGAPIGRKLASRKGSSARSRARSGGVRGGK